MKDIRNIDFLIAGQGIAGSLLSWFLLKNGYSCLVVDREEEFTSSRVAAGLIHPITGRRLTKTWNAEKFIPFAVNTYRDLEKELNCNIFYEYKVLEVFDSNKNRNDWIVKSEDPAFSKFLGETVSKDKIDSSVNAPFGAQWLLQSGWLDTVLFLNNYKIFLEKNKSFLKGEIKSSDLVLKEEAVEWKNITAKTFINCTGYIAKDDKWFSYLPFNPAKGEILTIESGEIPEDYIIHHNSKIIPKGNHHFICGSNYSWDKIDNIPTDEIRDQQVKNLEKTLTVPFKIINHRAGVRPSTDDRRPFLGKHSEHPQIAIFNGLGSKGVLIGPWLANKMTDHLCNDVPLDAEYSIKRFENRIS